MANIQSSLSNTIYENYREDILATRNNLFFSIEEKSPTLKYACESILFSKIKKNNSPLWGEIYPWFIVDIVGVGEDAKIVPIAKNWLAIYIHTIFIDKCLDEVTSINPNELLASSILAKEGLLNLQKIVIGTPYEKLFEDALNSSANFEMVDVIERLNMIELEKKEQVAIGKNRIILACAGAIAAIHNKDGEYIVEATKSLLLSLQFLDDLHDIEEDFENRSYSYLLSYGFKNDSLIGKNLSKEQILEQLLMSGALQATLLKIKNSLFNTHIIINSIKPNRAKASFGYSYFLNLTLEIDAFYNYISSIEKIYKEVGEGKKIEIIKNIETRIYRCDISS